MKKLLTEVGYVSLNDNKYHYFIQDHQGNNRVVFSQDGNVLTRMNTIRSELNSQGGNYGQRLDYPATPINGYNYVLFNRAAQG